MAKFVDRVVVHATAGSGGNGCASVHREKFKPLGGPDGGNGGRGGSVVLVVDPGVHTLLDFHHRPHATARNGKQGQGGVKAGANAADLELRVPDGTVVFDADGEIVADLVGPGTRFVAAAGGRGGLGNAALASAARKAPGFALLGEPGETRELVLELRSMADVGLVGFPSAGKSSLVAVLSAARPKIADYPFTTLVPQLGVVRAGEEIFTIADVPGLIPGAAEGRGLGLDFLRHIERCSVLVHVVDCATAEPGRDPVSDIEALEAELAQYTPALGGALADRPRLVVLNKIDVPEAARARRAGRRRSAGAFRLAGLLDLRGHPGRAARAVVRAGRAGARRPGRAAGGRAHPDRAAPAGRGRRRLHHRARYGAARRLPRARGPPGALGSADRVRQRRGGRIPGRPAGPARRRGGAGRGRCRAGCPGDHRRRHLRLGAEHPGRSGRAAVRPRHRPPAGAGRPGRRGRPQGGPGRAPRHHTDEECSGPSTATSTTTAEPTGDRASKIVVRARIRPCPADFAPNR